jgi:hypothetical protein
MRRLTGLTRTDVVVIVLVLGLLICLSVVKLLHSRADARRRLCEKRMGRVGVSLLSYANLNQAFPPGTVLNQRLPPARRLSW